MKKKPLRLVESGGVHWIQEESGSKKYSKLRGKTVPKKNTTAFNGTLEEAVRLTFKNLGG